MDDIDAAVRRMRPHGKRTVYVLLCVIAGLLLLLGWMASKAFISSKQILEQTPPLTTSKRTVVDREALTAKLKQLAPPSGTSRADVTARQAVAVSVATRSNDGYVSSMGSGLLIASGLVLTARHVVENAFVDRAEVLISVFCNGGVFAGALLFGSDPQDMALVSVPECDGETLSFSDRSPTASDKLHVAGYGYGVADMMPYWFHVTSSLLPDATMTPERANTPELKLQLERLRESGELPLLAVNQQFVKGNSGSVVFYDDGLIAGMMVIGPSGIARDATSFFMDARTITAELREYGVLIEVP